MKLEEEIMEVVTRGYLEKPTGKGRAFPFMNDPLWDSFVRGVATMQTIELLDLFKKFIKEVQSE